MYIYVKLNELPGLHETFMKVFECVVFEKLALKEKRSYYRVNISDRYHQFKNKNLFRRLVSKSRKYFRDAVYYSGGKLESANPTWRKGFGLSWRPTMDPPLL